MTSRGDMPHPQYVFSHNPDHGSLFPVAKKKLAGKPQRFEEQKKGLIAPMKLVFDIVNLRIRLAQAIHG